MGETSFEEWAALARADQAAFEDRRRHEIERFLDASGPQRRIGRALQREIDAERRRAESAQQAFSVVARMLTLQLAHLSEQMYSLGDDLRQVRRLAKSRDEP